MALEELVGSLDQTQAAEVLGELAHRNHVGRFQPLLEEGGARVAHLRHLPQEQKIGFMFVKEKPPPVHQVSLKDCGSKSCELSLDRKPTREEVVFEQSGSRTSGADGQPGGRRLRS